MLRRPALRWAEFRGWSKGIRGWSTAPHGGPWTFSSKSACLTQLPTRHYVVQIWSRYLQESGGAKPVVHREGRTAKEGEARSRVCHGGQSEKWSVQAASGTEPTRAILSPLRQARGRSCSNESPSRWPCPSRDSGRCRANLEHIRQSRPDSGHGWSHSQ